MRVVELLIPEGQEDIALSYNVTDQFGVVNAMQPRLAAGCVHVGVGSKEWHERTSLVPTHQQFSAWSVEEAANISYKRGRGTINSSDLPPLKLVACSELAKPKITILCKNRKYQHIFQLIFLSILLYYFSLDRQQHSRIEDFIILTTTENNSSQAQAQTHGERDLQVAPICNIIACPYGTCKETQTF